MLFSAAEGLAGKSAGFAAKSRKRAADDSQAAKVSYKGESVR